MTQHACECKMCKRKMVVSIDDDYAALGDPLNLLKLATCNRCADLRMRRSRIEDAIYKVCMMIIQTGTKPNAEGKPAKEAAIVANEILSRLTKQFALLVADWCGRSGMIWQPDFPLMLIENPDKWASILENYWRTFRQIHAEEKEPEEMATT